MNVLILLAALLVGADAPAPSDSKCSQQEGRTVTAEACLQHAFEAARAIQDGSVRRELLEWIGRDQACAGDLAGARRVVEVIEDDNGAAMVLAAVAEFQVKRGDRDAAKETLAEALKRGDRVDPQQRRELVTRIVEGYVAAGDLDQALAAASRFPDELDRTYAKIKIAEAHLAAGRHSEAGKFVHEAVAAYRTNSSDCSSRTWPRRFGLCISSWARSPRPLSLPGPFPPGTTIAAARCARLGSTKRRRAMPQQPRRPLLRHWRPQGRSKVSTGSSRTT